MFSFRYHHKNHHRHDRHNSVPTSPNESDLGLRKRSLSSPPESPTSTDETKSSGGTSCYTFQTGVRTSRSEDHLQCQVRSPLYTFTLIPTSADPASVEIYDPHIIGLKGSNEKVFFKWKLSTLRFSFRDWLRLLRLRNVVRGRNAVCYGLN